MVAGILWALVLYCGVVWGEPTFERLAHLPEHLIPVSAPVPSPSVAVLKRKLEFPPLSLSPLKDLSSRVILSGAIPYLVENRPELPIFVRQIAIPEGKQARVFLQNVELEQSSKPITLNQVRPPFEWSNTAGTVSDEKEQQDYFPGKLLKVRRSGGILYITLFPVQQHQQSKRLLIVRSADLVVNFHDQPPTGSRPIFRNFDQNDALIITTQHLLRGAERISNFHRYRLGIRTQIVTVEEIAEFESPLPESELPEGYKNADERNGIIAFNPSTNEGYNYALSRKIMHYLHRRMHELSPTKYVLLLGDANLVPPSYYFTAQIGSRKRVGVTDQCYANRLQCTEPWLTVGRLPFSSNTEITHYLGKLFRWLDSYQTFAGELSLYGGKTFPTADTYVGELSALATIQSQTTDWAGVKKRFRTEDNFNKDSVLQAFNGAEENLFLYYLDHGEGNYLRVGQEQITSVELEELGQAPSQFLPIILSPSCTNAAFDRKLLKEPLFKNREKGSTSVGSTLLKINSGAIAYLGSTRESLGTPLYTIDPQGNLDLTGSTHFLALLNTVLEKYRQQKRGRLGDLILSAMKSYTNDMGHDPLSDKHRWSYLGFELLGDPTLILPERRATQPTLPLATAISPFERTTRWEAPGTSLVPGAPIQIDFESSLNVSIQVYKIQPATFLTPFTQIRLPSVWEPPALSLEPGDEGTGRYLIRIENTEGVPVERRVWFEIFPMAPGQPHGA